MDNPALSPESRSPFDRRLSNGHHLKTPREVFTSHLLLSDQEILELGVRESDIELYRRKHYQAQFGIDTWYNELQQHTFKTESLAISYDEAHAIIKCHLKSTVSEEQQQLLDQLQERIHNLIKARFPEGCFLKLNTRSPKDVPVYDYQNVTVQKKIIGEIEQIDPSERDDNTETIAFIKATNKCLRLYDGREALRLLVQSSRISEDLSKVLQFGRPLFEAKLILREWIDEVANKPQMEFRCFVHKNSLNAITQYFCFTLFPDLIANKEEIKNRIVDFFEKELKGPLQTHGSYVIDLFVAHDRVMVIELNPFHNGAGACLFSWSKNRELFMNGPLEFRICEHLEENPKETLSPFWIRFIDNRFHPKPINEDDEDEEEEKKPIAYWPWTIALVMLGGIYAYKRYFRK